MKLQKGFSLIELMVTVFIIGILASLAVPAYQDYMRRGYIAEATSALLSKRVLLEQYYQDNRTYVGSTACNADSTSSKFFQFTCTGLGASTYTLTATGNINQAMAGFTYTLNESNARQTTAAPSDWQADPMPATCWITKKGGLC